VIRRLGMSTSLLWPAPLGEVLGRLGRAGFALVEISPDHLLRDVTDAGRAQEIRAQATSFGLDLGALHSPFGGENDLGRPLPEQGEPLTDRHRSVCCSARLLGVSLLITHPSDLERYRHAVEEVLTRSRLRLEALWQRCRAHDLTLAIEHMLPHLIGGEVEELRWLCDRLPEEGFGICLDIGHASFHGDLPGTIRSLGRRIVYVHASDNHRVTDEHALPGEGDVDWPAVLAALDEVGYAGPITVEPAPRQATPGPLVAMRQYLEDLLGGGAT
jgi:sugar phosphate isomerase/epimerase